ncbi:DUF3099 domain-containing protein [Skermania sp. ID1734]|uniref:DUF3099 domain-containing protein n=1 Tax=Skermania sp. ID1734 TaxID=2597516 RepID=UPI0011811263|nr:DUF3099 domain-containing protein [Skermania sp. ID1734]TSD99915.1 DUF3099 domain-containing protein [Skermania sp. ID1734]
MVIPPGSDIAAEVCRQTHGYPIGVIGNSPRQSRDNPCGAPVDIDRGPILITSASASLDDERHLRVRKYTILMALRLPALAVAAAVYSAAGIAWLAAAILAASLPLSWIAVLIANDRPPLARTRTTMPDLEAAMSGLPNANRESNGASDLRSLTMRAGASPALHTAPVIPATWPGLRLKR